MTKTYYKVLYLLSACRKYEMASVQSFIRAEVSRGAFPVPKGAEAFTAYAIASAKDLIPEMENAARLTLVHPITFKSIGEGLQLFEGCALRDLVDYRRRCKDKFIGCFDAVYRRIVQYGLWADCPDVMSLRGPRKKHVPPTWLTELFSRNLNNLKLQNITRPLDIHSRISQECITALKKHAAYNVCLRTHLRTYSTFYDGLETEFIRARDEVTHSLYFSIHTRFTSYRYALAVIVVLSWFDLLEF